MTKQYGGKSTGSQESMQRREESGMAIKGQLRGFWVTEFLAS